MSAQTGLAATAAPVSDAVSPALLGRQDADDRETPEPSGAFGEAVYDYATGTWSWSPVMYAVVGLHDDGGDPYAAIFGRMHDDDRERIHEVIERAIADAAPVSGQYRVTGDDGVTRSISFVGDVATGDDGSPARFDFLGFDVTAAVRDAAGEAVRAAMVNRAVIEQVKGALMHAYRLEEGAAFAILARYSQAGNVKLAVIAQRVADQLSSESRPASLLQLLDRAAASDST